MTGLGMAEVVGEEHPDPRCAGPGSAGCGGQATAEMCQPAGPAVQACVGSEEGLSSEQNTCLPLRYVAWRYLTKLKGIRLSLTLVSDCPISL